MWLPRVFVSFFLLSPSFVLVRPAAAQTETNGRGRMIERDSAKDQAVVVIFIVATLGLLVYALVRPWVARWVEVCFHPPPPLSSSSPPPPSLSPDELTAGGMNRRRDSADPTRRYRANRRCAARNNNNDDNETIWPAGYGRRGCGVAI